jgi:hypothetical protein
MLADIKIGSTNAKKNSLILGTIVIRETVDQLLQIDTFQYCPRERRPDRPVAATTGPFDREGSIQWHPCSSERKWGRPF